MIKKEETKKEELKNINELFEKNNGLIATLKIDKELKKQVLKINTSLYNLAATCTDLREAISIFIENVEQRTIDLIIDTLVRILKEYEICEKKPHIINDNYFHFDKNDLVIVDDYKIIERNIRNLSEDVLRYNCYFIIGKESRYSEEFSNLYDNINRITFHIIGRDYKEEEILSQLKNKLQENNLKCSISDFEWQEIINTSLNNNECYSSNCAEYLYKKAAHSKIINNIEVIDKKCYAKENIEIKNNENPKLEDLIGLDNVKKEITSLKNYLAMQKRIGSTIKNNYLNMLFLGSPGTGKTTVGRIYANILYDLGYIEENKLVEIIPTDLMANYVGQTKDKTRKILNEAKGGVLFIDEAYLISQATYKDGFASYMSEAVVELMKYMENPENVIIFAGYPIETRRIYDTNPGMKSRICKEIIFDDYSVEELLTILKNNLHKIGFKINKKAITRLKEVIKNEHQKKNFGNARFCNVLMQKLLINYANRNTDSDTYEIAIEDVKLEDNASFQIGFMEE